MSMPAAVRRLLVALSAVGSLLPGAGLPATVQAGEPARPVAVVDANALHRTWSWPLAPRPSVLARYAAPRSTYGAGHRGIDLAGAQGQEVLAVDAGVVTHVGVVAGRGTVSVTHSSGLRSTYEPVRGSVATGSTVTAGQVIGSVAGRTHCGGGCLHLGARRGEGYTDPRPLLGGEPVILLPLREGS
jgi:murein DD-endopeptidase MepM/ murein hydrolase activator NlpD